MKIVILDMWNQDLKTDKFRIEQDGHIFVVQRAYHWSENGLLFDSPSLNWINCTETHHLKGFSGGISYEMTKHFFSIESAKGYIKKILELESCKNEEETIIYHQYP